MQALRPVQMQVPMTQGAAQTPARVWVRPQTRPSPLQVELQQGRDLPPNSARQAAFLAWQGDDSQLQRQLQEQVRAQLWTEAQLGVTGPGRQAQVVEGFFANVPTVPQGTATKVLRQQSSQQKIAPKAPVETIQTSPAKLSPSKLTGNDSCATLPPKAEKAELAAGCAVEIDTCTFQIVAPLGVGSYGMVWSALSEEGLEVAVKEILCRSQAELQNAHFEGNLLDQLGRMELGGRACKDSLRMPALVVQETDFVESLQSWRVRLAMSRIPGIPLMILLEQKRLQREANELAMREKPETQPAMPMATVLRPLSEACRLTQELVVQLFPTLESISSVYYHRDINPRNILVDGVDGVESEGRIVSYGLVDFGMAVDAKQWQDDSSRGTWQTLEVGGDCRYWPVSAWVMFLHGPQEVQPGQPWRLEYQTQLDIHALGITALQVLVNLSPILPQADDASDGCLRETGEGVSEDGEMTLLMAKLRVLQDAWNKYWEDSTEFWNCLIECFTTGGDWNALKIVCVNHGVQDIVTKDLKALRSALSDAADAAPAFKARRERGRESQADALVDNLEGLLRALYSMISTGESNQFPTWAVARKQLGIVDPEPIVENAVVEASGARTRRLSRGPQGSSQSPRKGSSKSPSGREATSPRRSAPIEMRRKPSQSEAIMQATIVRNTTPTIVQDVGSAVSSAVMELGSGTRPLVSQSPFAPPPSVIPSILAATPRGPTSPVDPLLDPGFRSARGEAGRRVGAGPPPSSWKGPGVSMSVNAPATWVTRQSSAAGDLKATSQSPIMVRRGISTACDRYSAPEPPSRMLSMPATMTAPPPFRQTSSGRAVVAVRPPNSVREASQGRRSATNLGVYTPLPPQQYVNKTPSSPMTKHRPNQASPSQSSAVERATSAVRTSPVMVSPPANYTAVRGSSVVVEAPLQGIASGQRGSSVVVEAPRGSSVVTEPPPSSRRRGREPSVGHSVTVPSTFGAGSPEIAVAPTPEVGGYRLAGAPMGTLPNQALGVMRTPMTGPRTALSFQASHGVGGGAQIRRPSPGASSLVVPVPSRGIPATPIPGPMLAGGTFKMTL